MDPRTLHHKQRKRQLKDFEQKAKTMLSHKERNYLYGSLKEYQAYRQVGVITVTFLKMGLAERQILKSHFAINAQPS